MTATINLTYYKQYRELIDAPHLLVAGATGSGKSVFLRGFLMTLTALRTPENAGLVLIDPKRVELTEWAKTRHKSGYACELSDALFLLDRCIDLMEYRYRELQATGAVEWEGGDIYIVIDELADLMLTDPLSVRPRLQKILQLGRAAHIHLIAATQAPSRKVIPAELTLNFTHKLALRCDSAIESRQVINTTGAETLPLHGVGILRKPGSVDYLPIEYVSLETLKDHCRKI